ncbi:protein RETICULATA-RELATED 1, chloroplastic-like isoform X2 [Phoenix dactylifera]|uniref:Protein RETICULATA-RELATED 1, chloroplastic-like isoform X2 n=1 Tax=Phoenix dactylifera TaxID=42345 RepID=A0A8B9ATC7_PHODC|nr:protein RETICULATA-RELATED 1, chloroplastic-like isoform X2 [Phoenix dactylifera]
MEGGWDFQRGRKIYKRTREGGERVEREMGCHAVFHAATPQPLVALHRRSRLPPNDLSLSQNPNPHRRCHCPLLPPAGFAGPRKHRLAVRAAAAPAPAPEAMPGAVEPGQWDALERCFAASPVSDPPSCSSSPSSLLASAAMAPVMKGQYGAFGGVTLEKSKLDLSQKTTKSSAETATGGGGGDIGKKNFHGGGDGGDDGGDDDDYFDDFDEDDEGDEGGLFRRRLVLQELFDRKFVDAVLQEWYKTMINLPAGLRQAYEMGLVSSAQMVRFLSINARPTTSRFISRALPQSLSRAFIGRMLADPSFLCKLILEQAATIGCAVWWELKNRKERIKQEWDLALINVLTASACNAFIVWSLAPCRSYGNTFHFDLQNTIQKLPNNIFEKSYPLREFDLQKRIQSFFLYKVPELCLVGVIAGSLQGILSKVSSSKKEGRLSVTIPSVTTNALGYGSFLGLYANLRYQLLCGIDRFMFNHFDVLGVPIFFSTALRILNIQIGEISRPAWLGVEADPLLQSDNLLKAYNRPSEATDSPSAKWFISKNTIISGLGLLGIKQGSEKPEAKPSKAHRKRIVRKKASTTSA